MSPGSSTLRQKRRALYACVLWRQALNFHLLVISIKQFARIPGSATSWHLNKPAAIRHKHRFVSTAANAPLWGFFKYHRARLGSGKGQIRGMGWERQGRLLKCQRTPTFTRTENRAQRRSGHHRAWAGQTDTLALHRRPGRPESHIAPGFPPLRRSRAGSARWPSPRWS